MEKIEVTTEYTYPVYRAFYNFASYRRNTGRRIYFLVLESVMLICSIFTAIAGIMTKDYTYFGCIFAFLIIFNVLLFFIPRINYNGLIASKGVVSKTTFTDACITSEASGKSIQMTENYLWDGIHSAYDTKGFFYIFVARNQGIIVDKSKMSAQEIMWLGGMLASKLGKKYKIK